MTRTRVALFLALAASPAVAQDYNRQDIVRGLCQQDGCDEFTILAADRLKATADGTLLKTRIRGFHASHAGRPERRQEDGYVYCSPTRPVIMAVEHAPALEAMRWDPSVRCAQSQPPPRIGEREDDGLLAGARRLTNRAFDALDEMGDWMAGRR